MGQQVNFYMSPEDLAAFEQMLIQRGGVSFIPYELSAETVETVPTLTRKKEKSGSPSGLVYLARDSDVEAIRFHHIPVRSYWIVDELRSPVIELAKSLINEQTIRRGRLYFNAGYYDEHEGWVAKPKEFVRWGDNLLRWIRSHYLIDTQTKWYLGPHAYQLVASGEYMLNPL